ncbi:hypothetical protein CEH05_07270 [Halobacillus halophilus]|uniref:S-Ena type endospore appendage n=1 Tax=Halobacillus halophilus TaxID=1570 RepID=UPI0005A1D21F|nr:S-Ena type endospore appendage [Halobacillus halophilus]ASF38923.1 hypothetical protein CEH05_07270 [Halobacillus halophilus]
MGNCSACCPDQSVIGDIVTDNFCGNFVLSCNEEDPDINRIWSLDPDLFNAGAQSAATVSVYYDVGCDNLITMTATKRDLSTIDMVIPRQNTRSITVLDIIAIDIFCTSEGPDTTVCRGKYCVDLHYDVLEPPGI